jgi:hypothetical protein
MQSLDKHVTYKRVYSVCIGTSGIPGIAMEHYKALYSAVAPYLRSLAT